jgi:tetratricopeptide (TPR) repeat protein
VHLLRAGKAENDGDIETMGAELGKAQAEFEQVGDRYGVAMAMFIESGRLMLAGDLEGAETALEQAREALERLGPQTAAGMLDLRVADLRLRRGDYEGALEFARQAQEQRDLGSDEIAFLQAMLARIAWLEGDLETAERELAEARERIERRGPTLPQSNHGRALVEGLSASLAAQSGDFAAAERWLASAHEVALGTEDMPVLASVAVAGAALAAARGDHATEVELLTAAMAIRGADDPTNPEVARLTPERGPAMTQQAALATLSRAAGIGA